MAANRAVDRSPPGHTLVEAHKVGHGYRTAAKPWWTWRPVAALLIVAGLAGCERNGPSSASTSASDASSSAKQLDRLRSLPYLEYSETPDAWNEDGVAVQDPQRSCPGYTLYSSRSLRAVCLIDAAGSLVHSWNYPPGRRLGYYELLPNGDLLAIARVDPLTDYGRSVVRYSWDGRLLWRRKLTSHHDIEVTPRDQILTLVSERRRVPALDPDVDLRDHWLVLLSHQGEELERLSFSEVFGGGQQVLPLQKVAPTKKPGSPEIDLFHPNSIEWMHQPHLAAKHPLYALSNILVCMRHQDAIAVINWDAKKLVWAWGPGEISGPHDASVLENGNILLFDNGLDRGWSRVIEIDPVTERIVWEYKAPEPMEFYTIHQGASQRLDNGNTLITESGKGHAFEVTPDGQIVWEFWNPDLGFRGKRATVPTLKRYGLGFVEDILRRFEPQSRQ